MINGVASNVTRQSYTNGIQADGSYRINPANTIRTGFFVSGEQAFVGNSSLVEPAPGGVPVDAPFTITDDVSAVGWLAGVYAQDEWKVTDKFTINAGLRFDQMWQFVDANQLSPRISFTYKPFEYTTFHAGYARYFTPPILVEAAPANIALFNGTTGAPPPARATARCCRSARIISMPVSIKTFRSDAASRQQKTAPTSISESTFITRSPPTSSTTAIFGQALVLSAFNYAHGINEGIEFTGKFHSGNFQAYGNVAVAQQRATQVVSNQYLFDNTTPLADLGGLTEFQYVQSHWIYTDHNQFVTASGRRHLSVLRPGGLCERDIRRSARRRRYPRGAELHSAPT